MILEISAADYHRDDVGTDTPTLSASIAKILISQSPAHARAQHPRLNPDYVATTEDKYDVGTAAHKLLLEGESVIEVVNADNWRTKAAAEARDLARAHGRIPLLAHQTADVYAMVAATRAQLEAVDARPALFTDGQPERTLVWDEQGVKCRARLDWLRDDMAAIDDFKTTSRSANPDGWTRSTLFNIGCDIQAAFYLRGLAAVRGPVVAGMADFRFVVQETYAPYALSVISLGPDVLALADAKVDHAIKTWKRCLETDVWPAYPTQICWAELPAWEESRWLAREDVAA